VIFGEKDDSNLLGVTTLEALELVFDPFKRDLRPRTMPLMGAVPYAAPRVMGPAPRKRD